MKSHLLLVGCLVGVQCLLGARAIYVRPGDTHPGIDHDDPNRPKMMALNQDFLRQNLPMKAAVSDSDMKSSTVPTPTPSPADGPPPSEGHEQCTYTFNVPSSAEQQCGDGGKIRHMESQIQEMKTCIDKLKYKSSMMFMMGSMMDNNWSTEEEDIDDKMTKMTKMMKKWMEVDSEKTDAGEEGSTKQAATFMGESGDHDYGYILSTIEELKESVNKLQHSMTIQQENFEAFTDQLEDRLDSHQGMRGPPGHTGATGATGVSRSGGTNDSRSGPARSGTSDSRPGPPRSGTNDGRSGPPRSGTNDSRPGSSSGRRRGRGDDTVDLDDY